MKISYKPFTFNLGYSSSQYGIGILQTPSLFPLVSLSGPHHAVLTVPMTLLGGFDIICKDSGKSTCHVCAITSKELVNLELL